MNAMTEKLAPMLAKMVGEAVAAAMAAQPKAGKAKTAKPEGKSDRSVKNEKLAVTAFRKAGFKGDITPHVNVLTWDRWLAKGRKVKAGEKAVKVKNLRLFHIDQTEEISNEVRDDLLAKRQEKFAKKANEVAQVAA